MIKCLWCGREFEPLPLPELPKLFGLENPHKVICPFCAIKEGAKVVSFMVAVLEAYQKQQEFKKKEGSN